MLQYSLGGLLQMRRTPFILSKLLWPGWQQCGLNGMNVPHNIIHVGTGLSYAALQSAHGMIRR